MSARPLRPPTPGEAGRVYGRLEAIRAEIAEIRKRLEALPAEIEALGRRAELRVVPQPDRR